MLEIKNSEAKASEFLISVQCLTGQHRYLPYRSLEIKKDPSRGLSLFLLLVDAVGLGDWVELFGFVFLTWVLLILVVEAGVVGMAFPNAIFVAY